MFEKLTNILKKDNKKESEKEYLSCRFLHGGITFMHHYFRTCCSNKEGITFVDDYKGEPIDWKHIAEVRKKVIENCKKGILPENCKGCVELEKKKWGEHNLIDDIYINHWDQCNCACVYCVVGSGKFLQKEAQPSKYYQVYPHLKELYKHKMISKDVHVEMVGGDLTVLDETEKIINLCLDNGVGRMSFHSSCIYYSEGIERALKEAPVVDIDFSLDCGDRELYKKIKHIDAFDDVIANLKRYIASSEKAKDSLIAKYIIIDDYNDNIEALEKWLQVVHSLGIRNTRVDLNFKRFFPEFNHENPTVPKHYYDMFEHYNKRIKELGFKDRGWEFHKRVLEEGGIPSGYKNS